MANSTRSLKSIRSDEEIQSIRAACQIAATVLQRLVDSVAVGMTTYDLDQLGRKHIESLGAEVPVTTTAPATACSCLYLHFGERGNRSWDSSLHQVIAEGDAVSIDVVVRYKGFIGDNAATVLMDPVADEIAKMVNATRESLDYAITYAKAGNRVGDISNAVERFIKRHRYGIVREFVGHGVGATMLKLRRSRTGRRGSGALLKPGMALAIEPMINLGTAAVEILDDGWTAVTTDRKPSAHFEHTVLVTNGDPEILTIPKI